MPALAHLSDPDAILERSFALVREAARLDALPPARRAIAARIVHATGMPELAGQLAWSGDPDAAGRAALAAGRPILVDARMVAAGIGAPQGRPAPTVICTLDAAPRRSGGTRAAAAVDLWEAHAAGAVIAIGNAPTALFRLLECLADWAARPAAILAFPVGFVGAAESKAALMAAALDIPWVTLPGRLGGSAMAVAAANALLRPPP